jgi:hypothetical protein
MSTQPIQSPELSSGHGADAGRRVLWTLDSSGDPQNSALRR